MSGFLHRDVMQEASCCCLEKGLMSPPRHFVYKKTGSPPLYSREQSIPDIHRGPRQRFTEYRETQRHTISHSVPETPHFNNMEFTTAIILLPALALANPLTVIIEESGLDTVSGACNKFEYYCGSYLLKSRGKIKIGVAR